VNAFCSEVFIAALCPSVLVLFFLPEEQFFSNTLFMYSTKVLYIVLLLNEFFFLNISTLRSSRLHMRKSYTCLIVMFEELSRLDLV